MISSPWKRSAALMLNLTGMLWVIELINSSLLHRLNVLGIYPRSFDGLSGVLLWPFLHGDIQHLLVNTMPFFLLGWLVGLRGAAALFRVSLIIIVFAGICVWLFGRSSYHIGASGLVFGYFGYLVTRGLIEQSLKALFIASLVLFYYGGLIVGVLPSGSGISWETHLFGLVAGVIAAQKGAVTRH